MTSNNAGIRRNRRPAGEHAEKFQVRLSSETAERMRRAARESGNLSYSLYLERIVAMLCEEHGTLPVFVDEEEAHTAAA